MSTPTPVSGLQLIGIVVSQLGLIARDPALGYRGAALTEALALLGTIIAKGDAARAELEALAAQVQSMVEHGKEPDKEEFGVLRALSKQHHEVLNPPPPEEAESVEGTDDK